MSLDLCQLRIYVKVEGVEINQYELSVFGSHQKGIRFTIVLLQIIAFGSFPSYFFFVYVFPFTFYQHVELSRPMLLLQRILMPYHSLQKKERQKTSQPL